MGTRRYRQHSAADKVAILRRVLLEGQAVSAVCEEHDLSPTLFYTWQKQFFENGAAAFAKDAGAEQRELARTVEVLRQRLGQKDRVIAAMSGLTSSAARSHASMTAAASVSAGNRCAASAGNGETPCPSYRILGRSFFDAKAPEELHPG